MRYEFIKVKYDDGYMINILKISHHDQFECEQLDIPYDPNNLVEWIEGRMEVDVEDWDKYFSIPVFTEMTYDEFDKYLSYKYEN